MTFLGMRTNQYLQLFDDLGVRAGVPDMPRITRMAEQAWKHHQNPNSYPHVLQHLESRWYATTDYTVYDDADYLAEAFTCWLVYSRKYARALTNSPLTANGTVVDLGCGIGFSTAGLAEVWPHAPIIGTQLPETWQHRIATELSKQVPYTLQADTSKIGHADVVFASEYFEHFEAPIEHLEVILSDLSPRLLILASTFTQPSIGHFDSYTVNGEQRPGREASRLFNRRLTEHGYRQVTGLGFWNNRPRCWERNG